MPIVYAVEMDGALVIEAWTGAITVDDLYAHRSQQAVDPAIVGGARVLADARTASFRDISDAEMAQFARAYSLTEKRMISRATAFVAGGGFAKARVYEKASRSFLRNVVVFTNLATACKWLGIDAGLVTHTIETLRDNEP